jgi:phosphoglycerate dehydrogenase-like enzyme
MSSGTPNGCPGKGVDMTDTKRIVFLHSKRAVPQEIIDIAYNKVPPGFDFELLEQGTEPAEKIARFMEADFILGYPGDMTEQEIRSAARCKLLQLMSAGYDRILLPVWREMKVPVANNGGANAIPVAEHAVLLMLAVCKWLPQHHMALRGGQWLGHARVLRMFELRQKTVGIVGFGHIGREVARCLLGFQTNTLYYDVVRAAAEVEQELNARQAPLDELLRQSDLISLHTPLLPQTRGLIGAPQLALMKPTAILVNTSRGPIVDEPALYEALKANRILGAGLDVFAQEPVDPKNPLLQLENVVISPHVAGSTYDTWFRRLDFAFGNITRVARGEAPSYVIL